MNLPRPCQLLVLTVLLVGLAGLGLLPGRAAPPAPAPTPAPAPGDLDDEERAEQRALARRLVQENCLICHSEEMVARQRLTPVQWKTEVEKMVGWGAPLLKEQEPSVIDFLASEYSDQTPLGPPARISYEEALATVKEDPATDRRVRGNEEQGATVYAANCATCHGTAARGGDLGPNLVERPVLLRRDEYDRVVRQGRRRMPGFQALLKPDQEDDMLAWLRRQRYGSASP